MAADIQRDVTDLHDPWYLHDGGRGAARSTIPIVSSVMRALSRFSFALVLAFTGCNDDGPFSVKEMQETRAARARWLASSVRAAYRVEVRQSCFCPPDVDRWHTVTVIDNVITDVRNSESGVVISPERRSAFLTVERMFAAISPPAGYYRDVTVRFDSRYGYPLEVTFDPGPDVLDAGGAFYARNLQPAPRP